MKKQNIRALTVSGIMGAAGFVLMLLEFPIPALIPPFIKFDFSELPAIITAFSLGPVWGILVCLIKNLLHLTVSSSLGIGELSNFLLGAVFTGTAALFYKYNKTRKGALLGALAGAVLMSVISVATNYFLVYPFYTNIIPMEGIISMYKTILPFSDTLIKSLLIFNLPFTFFKGAVDTLLCFAVYKKLSPILKNFSK